MLLDNEELQALYRASIKANSDKVMKDGGQPIYVWAANGHKGLACVTLIEVTSKTVWHLNKCVDSRLPQVKKLVKRTVELFPEVKVELVLRDGLGSYLTEDLPYSLHGLRVVSYLFGHLLQDVVVTSKSMNADKVTNMIFNGYVFQKATASLLGQFKQNINLTSTKPSTYAQVDCFSEENKSRVLGELARSISSPAELHSTVKIVLAAFYFAQKKPSTPDFLPSAASTARRDPGTESLPSIEERELSK